MSLPSLFCLYSRIELLDKLCRDLKIVYLQSNLIPKIGKLHGQMGLHTERANSVKEKTFSKFFHLQKVTSCSSNNLNVYKHRKRTDKREGKNIDWQVITQYDHETFYQFSFYFMHRMLYFSS